MNPLVFLAVCLGALAAAGLAVVVGVYLGGGVGGLIGLLLLVLGAAAMSYRENL